LNFGIKETEIFKQRRNKGMSELLEQYVGGIEFDELMNG